MAMFVGHAALWEVVADNGIEIKLSRIKRELKEKVNTINTYVSTSEFLGIQSTTIQYKHKITAI